MMHDRTIPAAAAWGWIREGLDRIRREPARWLGMTLMYLLLALLLRLIVPLALLYNFLLALVTPIMLGSAVIAAHSESIRPAPKDARGWLRELTVESLRELFQVFRREEYGFAIVIVCIVTLGLVVFVDIPNLLITGGSIVSGLASASLAGPMQPTAIVGIVVVAILYLLVTMALFYLVPLSLFGNRQPIPAIAESFHACLRYRAPLAVFVAPFLGVDLLILFGFGWSHRLGYVLLAAFGIVSLPIFVIGMHSSYRSIFEAPAQPNRP